MKKKILSLLLVLAMAFSLVPGMSVSAGAETVKTLYVNSAWTSESILPAGIEWEVTAFNTVQAAVTAAGTDSATIVMMSDSVENVTVSDEQNVQDITLDLNGHVLCAPAEGGSVIQNNGLLTVTDTSDGTTLHYFNFVSFSADDAEKNGVWTLNTQTDGTGAITVDEITSETADGTLIMVTGGVITGGTASGIRAYDSEVLDLAPETRKLVVRNVSIVGNWRNLHDGGGAIITNMDTYLYDCNFYGNGTGGDGGAIDDFYGTTLSLENCDVRYNSASIGGGIYYKGENLSLLNTVISDNIAAYFGGGVWMGTEPTEFCLPRGTLITMADGSVKNIEDVKEGDVVRTFDHETGKLSSESVFLAYEGEGTGTSFELHFADDTVLGIVGCHDLFEKSSLKYVTIDENNAQSFVGKYFYNADNACWTKLESVSCDGTQCTYYSLYTVQHMNCVANGMLTCPDDVDYVVNVFDLNEDLSVNQEKKQADIEKYGLLPFEDCVDIDEYTYDNFNAKYYYIYIGKGLTTDEALLEDIQNTEKYLASRQKMFVSAYEPALTGTLEEPIFVTIGSNVVIQNNEVVPSSSVLPESYNLDSKNLYLRDETAIKVASGATGINVGVSTQTEATAASPVTISVLGTADYSASFHSDSEAMTVKFNNNDTETDATDDYLMLTVSDDYMWYYGHKEGDYVISNTAELEALAKIVNSGKCSFEDATVRLANNFKNAYTDGAGAALKTPIGTHTDRPFKGTFDGNGKEVVLNVSSEYYGGMFGCVSGGTIKNVGTSGTVKGYENAGGIVGMTTADSRVVNCYSTCSVTAAYGDEKTAGGIVGDNGGTVTNCYATGTVTGDASRTGGIVGMNSENGTVENCYCLDLCGSTAGTEVPASQMKAIAKQTEESSWAELGSYGKVSVSDALNRYVGRVGEFCGWGVMKSGETPVLTMRYCLFLINGYAFETTPPSEGFDGMIDMPDGISYKDGVYIFDNVSLASNGYTAVNFMDNSAVVELRGTNRIGSLADTSKFVDTYEPVYTDLAIIAENITFTGSGSLTIYDESAGISSGADITFDENFTGTVTVNDYGAKMAPACCISTSGGNVTIKNGTFYLNNTATYGIQAVNIDITGGTVYVKGGTAAIDAYEALNIDSSLEVTGAAETYKTGVTTLTNKVKGEYVVIKSPNSAIIPEEPETDVCKQDETCVYAKFTDADTKAWYHDGVHYCVEKKLMDGVSGTEFAPNGTLSRAMIVTILWRMEGSPVVNYAMTFKDVPEDEWYTDAIRWAQSTDVVEGYTDLKFGPTDDVTREQLVTILWRYAKYKGYDVSVGEDTNILSYDDAIGGISDWAIPAMQWAVGAGIIEGIDGNLVARGNASRAQAACMIQRFCETVVK